MQLWNKVGLEWNFVIRYPYSWGTHELLALKDKLCNVESTPYNVHETSRTLSRIHSSRIKPIYLGWMILARIWLMCKASSLARILWDLLSIDMCLQMVINFKSIFLDMNSMKYWLIHALKEWFQRDILYPCIRFNPRKSHMSLYNSQANPVRQGALSFFISWKEVESS